MRTTILTIAFAVAVAAPAAAQQLTVEFNDGLVTIDATSVPVRTILNEWAKKGGTKVVGVERVTGAPLTVKLVDIPEAKALDIILRSVAGYMAAPRSTGAGSSIYDRIMVMATSSTPPPVAAPTRPNQPMPGANGTQRFIPPQRQVSDDDDNSDEDDPTPPNPPVFTFPGAPGSNAQPTFQANPQPAQMIVNPAVNPANGGTAQPMQINPAQPGGYPPAVPFGTSTPGMITPQAPSSTTTPVRPPGGRQQQ